MKHKYKVGDKVRITNKLCGHLFKIGEVVTLTENKSHNWHAKGDKNMSYIIEEEFKPYTPAVTKPTTAPKSQTELILAHLRKGRKLTSIEALNRFRCLRCASRINDIRTKGLLKESEQLHSVMVTRNNKRFAEYFISVG